MSLTSNFVCKPGQETAVEYFGEGAVLLNLSSGSLLELDAHESWILRQCDGERPADQIIADFGQTFRMEETKSKEIIESTVEKLLRGHYLVLKRGLWQGGPIMTIRYVQNPNVNLRDEDEAGGLLYDPDADRVKLLNSTGLYIWKYCGEERSVDEIVAAITRNFEDATEEEARSDVQEFIQLMVEDGFIKVLES